MAPVAGRDKWAWERGQGGLQRLECCAEGLGLFPEGSRAEGLAQSLKCPEGSREPVPGVLATYVFYIKNYFVAQKFMERP